MTGALAALSPTPGMIGYGLAKSAVHHLVQDLAQPNGGLPQDAKVAGILPYVSFILCEKSTHFLLPVLPLIHL